MCSLGGCNGLRQAKCWCGSCRDCHPDDLWGAAWLRMEGATGIKMTISRLFVSPGCRHSSASLSKDYSSPTALLCVFCCNVYTCLIAAEGTASGALGDTPKDPKHLHRAGGYNRGQPLAPLKGQVGSPGHLLRGWKPPPDTWTAPSRSQSRKAAGGGSHFLFFKQNEPFLRYCFQEFHQEGKDVLYFRNIFLMLQTDRHTDSTNILNPPWLLFFAHKKICIC